MTQDISRIIFGYWHQGRDAAPEEIRQCWDLWDRMNPGWELRILEWADVQAQMTGFGISHGTMSYTALSDMVRIASLADHGGIWVDAYTVPLQPLHDWLPPLTGSGFFAFHDPYRKRMVETWFIASRAGHPLITGWRDQMVRYWQSPRRPMRFKREMDKSTKGALARMAGRVLDATRGPLSARGGKHIFHPRNPTWAVSPQGGARYPAYPYFAVMMLFDLMLDEDPSLFDAWRQYPKVTSYDNLLLRHWKKLYSELTPLDIRRMAEGKVMQKLNLPTKLPAPLMATLVSIAEDAMPRG